MTAYSFLDVSGTLSGPTGSIELGSGAANSEEGIVVAMTEAKNTMADKADMKEGANTSAVINSGTKAAKPQNESLLSSGWQGIKSIIGGG